MLIKNAEKIAILEFLSKSFVKRYIGKTASAPKKAEGKRAANSLTPKINVAIPDKYIGMIGG